MKRTLSILLFLALAACGKSSDPTPATTTTTAVTGHQCGASETDRVGARCSDGTDSSATGSGACSSHGGVAYWICS